MYPTNLTTDILQRLFLLQNKVVYLRCVSVTEDTTRLITKILSELSDNKKRTVLGTPNQKSLGKGSIPECGSLLPQEDR